MKKITNLAIISLLVLGIGLTSCDELLDNPVVPNISPEVEKSIISIEVDFQKFDADYLNPDKTSLVLIEGDEIMMYFTILPNELANTIVTLTSADNSIISIDGLRIKALKEGETKVIAKAGDRTVECSVTVNSLMFITPLTLEAQEAGAKVKLKNDAPFELKPIYYKVNDGDWTEYSIGHSIELGTVGDKVQFWSNNSATATSISDFIWFDVDKKCYAYGNMMSLIDDQEGATKESPNFSRDMELNADFALYGLFFNNSNGVNILSHETKKLILPATKLTKGCYLYLFFNCSSLTTAPKLPAITLANECYFGMFQGCSSLTKAPELPAITLANDCYYQMFSDCLSLTTAPELPAEILKLNCYHSMFYNCTSLTSAPKLNSTTLAEECYGAMFYNCTSLAKAPELPATTLTRGCYQNMFYNCTSLTKAPELPADKLANDCYNNMFCNCSSLTTAPELPAEELVYQCYHSMFYNCKSLTTAPKLPATNLAYYCYKKMFYNCESLTSAYVKSDFRNDNSYMTDMFYGVAPTGIIHTASGNTAWEEYKPNDWTVITDY